MKLNVFVIYDCKSMSYSNPYYASTLAAGLRTFCSLVQDPSTLINKYPHDYFLYTIGIYDNETGELTPNKPQQVAQADDFLNTQSLS